LGEITGFLLVQLKKQKQSAISAIFTAYVAVKSQGHNSGGVFPTGPGQNPQGLWSWWRVETRSFFSAVVASNDD
jgi:hypothetical protein